MIYQIAALTIQSAWKIFQFRRQRKMQYANSLDNKTSSSAIDDLAALVIQVCWRSFCSRRIFKYFRDLICVKLKGAPADLLKCIVPNESSFLDFASGNECCQFTSYPSYSAAALLILFFCPFPFFCPRNSCSLPIRRAHVSA